MALLLGSCTSAGDPTLQLANPALTDQQGSSPALAEIGASEAGSAAPAAKVATAKTAPAKAAPEGAGAETGAAVAESTATEEIAPKSATKALADTAKPDPKVAATANPGGQILENGGPYVTAGSMPQPEAKKKGFMSSFFGTPTASAAAVPSPVKETKAKPIVQLASTAPAGKKTQAILDLDDPEPGQDFLPGVRREGLFEITRKSGLDDISDIDVHEDVDGPPVVMASAAGLARLAPNGLLKQRDNVDVACLKPGLVRVLKTVERHFGKKMVVTSGYRSPAYNRKVNGAKRSQHMYCAAADVQVPGVSKWELARFVRSMPGRGGVGTYCHTESVHIDIGPERDWNWRCRGRT